MMKSQKDLIHKKHWDVLVILDACRYDFFEELYRDYFDGDLRKVKSPASCTNGWIRKTWIGDNDEIVYVSGNPRINSKFEVEEFRAAEHFHSVVDVWDWGWDSDYETILPRTMSKATRRVRIKYPAKRMVSHFAQPHRPYIGEPSFGNLKMKEGGDGDSFFDYILEGLVDLVYRCFDSWRYLALKNKFKTTKSRPAKDAEKIGRGKVVEYYKENLKHALESVEGLCERLPDSNIVISADHGEFLGEHGVYRHPRLSRHSILRDVPWLEVEN